MNDSLAKIDHIIRSL